MTPISAAPILSVWLTRWKARWKIWATRRTEPPEDFPLFLERLYAAAHDGDSVLVKELFQQLVPEYVPSVRKETLVSTGAPYPDGF